MSLPTTSPAITVLFDPIISGEGVQTDMGLAFAGHVQGAVKNLGALQREISIGLKQAETGEFSSRSVADIAAAVLAEDDEMPNE